MIKRLCLFVLMPALLFAGVAGAQAAAPIANKMFECGMIP